MIQKITGLVLDPYFSATKINWILNNARKKQKILNKNMTIYYLQVAFMCIGLFPLCRKRIGKGQVLILLSPRNQLYCQNKNRCYLDL